MPRWEGTVQLGTRCQPGSLHWARPLLLESTDWDANFPAAAAMWHLKQWRNRINSEGPASLDTLAFDTGLQLWFSSAPFHSAI